MPTIRLVYYLLFIFVAVPIDMVLDFADAIQTPDEDLKKELLLHPISDAVIYIYAFVLTAETGFRILQHHDLFQRRPSLPVLGIGVFFVVVLFVTNYVSHLRDVIQSGGSVASSWPMQAVVLAVALTISVLSYRTIEAAKLGIRQDEAPDEPKDQSEQAA